MDDFVKTLKTLKTLNQDLYKEVGDILSQLTNEQLVPFYLQLTMADHTNKMVRDENVKQITETLFTLDNRTRMSEIVANQVAQYVNNRNLLKE